MVAWASLGFGSPHEGLVAAEFWPKLRRPDLDLVARKETVDWIVKEITNKVGLLLMFWLLARGGTKLFFFYA
ncbi:hypothetical protein Patl1_09426 [Pistacia atlantica]|uniref:Uncharacterized protein n=1 Tax=Pistacia atlantica TaxID=434234 RepID=A0ACC1ADP5_9ROSI|nr:hypothetical protein Patl1_09426 [Pistacia atlantica]